MSRTLLLFLLLPLAFRTVAQQKPAPDSALTVLWQYDYIGEAHNGFCSVGKNGKYGAVNRRYQQVVPCIYAHPLEFENGVATVHDSSKTGLVDTSGKTVALCIYDYFTRGDDYQIITFEKYITAGLNGKFGRLDYTGKVITPFEYDEIEPLNSEYKVVRRNNLCGMIDQSGKLILPVQFKNISYLQWKYIRVTDTNGKCKLLDKNCKELVPWIAGTIKDYSEGRIFLRRGGKIGIVDKKGRVLKPFNWADISALDKTNFLKVQQDGKYGLADKEGNMLTGFLFDGITDDNDGRGNPFVFFKVAIGRSYGLVNREGEIVVPCAYDAVAVLGTRQFGVKTGMRWRLYRPGIGEMTDTTYDDIKLMMCGHKPSEAITVGNGGKWGAIDSNGRLTVPYLYDKPLYFEDGQARIDGHLSKFVRPDGSEEHVKCKKQVYAQVEYFSDNRAMVTNRCGLYGFVDKRGREIIACQYENATSFSNGLAAVRTNGLYGYIDGNGRFIIAPQYEAAMPFTHRYAAVKRNGKWNYIDTGGDSILKKSYPYTLASFNPELWLTSLADEDSTVFIDSTGSITVIRTDSMDVVSGFGTNGLAWVACDGKFGLINKAGKTVVPFLFSKPGLFSAGLAPVTVDVPYQKTASYGLIDDRGVTRLPFKYTYISPFSSGTAVVQRPFDYLIIDTNFRVLTILQASDVVQTSEGNLSILQDGKWRLADNKGNVISRARYNQFIGSFHGLIIVRQGKFWKYIDSTGKTVVKLKYEPREKEKYVY